MLFWIGVIISLGALLGIPLWRDWIQSRLCQATDRSLDIIRSLVILGGLVISVVSHLQSAHEKEALQRSLQITQDSLSQQGNEIADARQKQTAAEQRFREAEERESLRVVAMITPHGKVAVNTAGMQTYPGGFMAERHKKVFIEEGSKMHFSGPSNCARKEYIDDIKSLVKEHPKVPYAYVALTWCLKEAGDPSWREEAERAKRLLEKLMAIQPHVMQIDSFYGFITKFILEEKLEDSGYFRVGENGIYYPVGQP